MEMIQIDMPMPTNCFDCLACNEYLMCAIPVNGRKWGENDVREFCQGRPEWCSLKEQDEKPDKCIICEGCGHKLQDDWNWCPWCKWETARGRRVKSDGF